jgi:hypothetical protein
LGSEWGNEGEKRDRGRDSHTWLASSLGVSSDLRVKNYYQSPEGRSNFPNHFNNLEECDCLVSAAVRCVN